MFAARHDTFDAVNLEGRMLRGLESNDGAAVSDGYLATFTYEASRDAKGQFVIDVATGEGSHTFLVAPDDGMIEILGNTATVVTVSERR